MINVELDLLLSDVKTPWLPIVLLVLTLDIQAEK
jgi:hypothetical protein